MSARTNQSRRRAHARTLVPRPDVEDLLEPPPHPGEILFEEFLRLHDLVRGRRGVTPDTALRLARALGTSTELWLHLQIVWDLWHAAHDPGSADIADIEPLALG